MHTCHLSKRPVASLLYACCLSFCSVVNSIVRSAGATLITSAAVKYTLKVTPGHMQQQGPARASKYTWSAVVAKLVCSAVVASFSYTGAYTAADSEQRLLTHHAVELCCTTNSPSRSGAPPSLCSAGGVYPWSVVHGHLPAPEHWPGAADTGQPGGAGTGHQPQECSTHRCVEQEGSDAPLPRSTSSAAQQHSVVTSQVLCNDSCVVAVMLLARDVRAAAVYVI